MHAIYLVYYFFQVNVRWKSRLLVCFEEVSVLIYFDVYIDKFGLKLVEGTSQVGIVGIYLTFCGRTV